MDDRQQDHNRAGSLALSGKWLARPTTDAEHDALVAFAASPAAKPQPATRDQLARHLDFMEAALPSRNTDEATGRKRAAVYASILNEPSNEALAYMAREACKTLDWFPTPRQCLEILKGYQPPVSDRDIALRLCSDYQHDKFETWAANVRAGSPLGDVPDQWLRIGVEQGFARRLDSGAYVSRALYQGPSLPASASAFGRIIRDLEQGVEVL